MRAIEADALTSFRETVKALDTPSMRIYDEIMDMVSQIDTSTAEVKSLWLTGQRGTYEEYKNESGRDRSIRTKQAFLKSYPSETIWLLFHAINDEYGKRMCINRWNFVLEADAQSNDEDGMSCPELLEWIRDRVREAIREVEEGTYNEKVAKGLPYKYRYGTILRKIFWNAFPEYREYEYKNTSEEERKRFLALVAKEGKTNIPETRVKDMTFNKYFDMVYPCYLAMEKDVPDIAKDAFFKFAEDFGGSVLEREVDYDSTQDFDVFLQGKFGFWGGHPWGMLRGSSRTRIMLYPKHTKDGYYFLFSGNPNWNIHGIIKSYLALKDTGAPVMFPYPEETIAYIKEEDLIGFVSCDEFPVYCQLSFPNRIVNDFRHYDEKKHKKIFDFIDWQPIGEVRLKQ